MTQADEAHTFEDGMGDDAKRCVALIASAIFNGPGHVHYGTTTVKALLDAEDFLDWLNAPS